MPTGGVSLPATPPWFRTSSYATQSSGAVGPSGDATWSASVGYSAEGPRHYQGPTFQPAALWGDPSYRELWGWNVSGGPQNVRHVESKAAACFYNEPSAAPPTCRSYFDGLGSPRRDTTAVFTGRYYWTMAKADYRHRLCYCSSALAPPAPPPWPPGLVPTPPSPQPGMVVTATQDAVAVGSDCTRLPTAEDGCIGGSPRHFCRYTKQYCPKQVQITTHEAHTSVVKPHGWARWALSPCQSVHTLAGDLKNPAVRRNGTCAEGSFFANVVRSSGVLLDAFTPPSAQASRSEDVLRAGRLEVYFADVARLAADVSLRCAGTKAKVSYSCLLPGGEDAAQRGCRALIPPSPPPPPPPSPPPSPPSPPAPSVKITVQHDGLKEECTMPTDRAQACRLTYGYMYSAFAPPQDIRIHIGAAEVGITTVDADAHWFLPECQIATSDGAWFGQSHITSGGLPLVAGTDASEARYSEFIRAMGGTAWRFQSAGSGLCRAAEKCDPGTIQNGLSQYASVYSARSCATEALDDGWLQVDLGTLYWLASGLALSCEGDNPSARFECSFPNGVRVCSKQATSQARASVPAMPSATEAPATSASLGRVGPPVAAWLLNGRLCVA